MQHNLFFAKKLFRVLKRQFTNTQKNPYDILGIKKSASRKEIKKAFIKLTKEFHPDKNPEHGQKYREINNAYQTLSNETKRKQFDEVEEDIEEPYDFGLRSEFTGFHYDDYGSDWQFEDGENHFESVFRDYDDFFKFPESTYKQEKAIKGTNIVLDVDVTFPEAINGVVKKVNFWKKDVCSVCEGTRSKPGTVPIKCKKCECTGSQTIRDGDTVIKSECRRCNGKGFIIKEKCEKCRGNGTEYIVHHEIVNIPRGIKNGHEIRLHGKGNKGDHGGQRGDVSIVLRLIQDDYYRIDGYDLHIEKPISLSKSVLGGEEIVETLEGELAVEVPKHVGADSVVKMEKKGLKGLDDGDYRGDLYIWFRVALPEKISDAQLEVLNRIKNLELKVN